MDGGDGRGITILEASKHSHDRRLVRHLQSREQVVRGSGNVDMTAHGVTGGGGYGRIDTVQSGKGDGRGAMVGRLQRKACKVALVFFSQVKVGAEALPPLTEGAGPV
jgi:hypothetical protein